MTAYIIISENVVHAVVHSNGLTELLPYHVLAVTNASPSSFITLLIDSATDTSIIDIFKIGKQKTTNKTPMNS